MLRILFAACLALLPAVAHAQGQQQATVDRATLAVQEMGRDNPGQLRANLSAARAVMICPRIFKAGFFSAAKAADVYCWREAERPRSYPAFYNIGSGSFGLQFGIEDSQLIMLIMTDRGLSAVLDSQFKIGANASIAVATIGAGVQGSTTAAVGADIVAFSENRGLFGGIALEGSIMSTLTEWNQAYYGQPFAARQIVIMMQANNPGADPLRAILMQWGAPAAPVAAAYPVASSAQSYAPAAAAPQPMMTAPTGSVQSQPLASPRR